MGGGGGGGELGVRVWKIVIERRMKEKERKLHCLSMVIGGKMLHWREKENNVMKQRRMKKRGLCLCLC